MKASHSLLEALMSLLVIWMILSLLSQLSPLASHHMSNYLFDQLTESCSLLCELDVHIP